MIQINKLTFSYGARTLFKEVSFSMQKGEHIGFVGRNGTGKSTLFKLIMGFETPDSGTIQTPKNYTLGYLDQHIRFSKDSVIEEACTALRDPAEQYKAEMILMGLGFSYEDLEKSPHDFSGGFQLRLHLAKVLVSEPDCLLLDEPTNYLDIVSIRWLKDFLREFPGEFICITHDREFMDDVCTHIMGLHRESMKKIQGTTLDYFSQIIVEEEIYEKTRQNLAKKVEHAQSFIDRFGAKATKAAQANARKKMIAKIPIMEKLAALENLRFEFHECEFSGKRMIRLEDVSFSYIPQIPIIEHFSLDIENGETMAIIGKNGYGKSTLLRLIAQDLTPLSGKVEASSNLHVGYFGQTHIQKLNPAKTIEEEVQNANSMISSQEVKNICGLMLFSGDMMKKKISVLSGGEKSRVLLARILAKRCNLLLLDEPTHHLDMESIEALIEAIGEFQGSVVIVTHSEEILRRLPLDRLIYCNKGTQEHFLGDYETFLRKRPQGDELTLSSSSKPTKKNEKKELLSQKHDALKQIEVEMKKCETKIDRLEKEHKKREIELASAIEKGKGDVPMLSQSLTDLEDSIEKEFAAFENWSQRYLEEEKRFDKIIEKLD